MVAFMDSVSMLLMLKFFVFCGIPTTLAAAYGIPEIILFRI